MRPALASNCRAFERYSRGTPWNSAKLPAGWVPDEPILDQFHDYLMKQNVQFSEADWTRDHDWVRKQLRQQMYVTAFSFEDSEKVGVEQDPEVAKAVEVMPQASDLLARSKVKFEKQRASR